MAGWIVSLLEAFLLGGLQGLAEFLPISSSGHLAVFQYFFLSNSSHHDDFFLNILLHFATMIALVVYFRGDILNLLTNLFSKQRKEHSFFAGQEVKFFSSLVLSVFATAIVGLLLKDIALEATNNISRIGVFFMITAVFLWLSSKMNPIRSFKEFQYKDALIIGIAQGIAVMPGLSRSGLTICVALFLGIERQTSAKYSLFLAIPTIAAVTFVELFDMAEQHFSLGFSAVFAMLVAGVLGYFAIHWIIFFVKRNKFHFFSPYLLILGLMLIFYKLS